MHTLPQPRRLPTSTGLMFKIALLFLLFNLGGRLLWDRFVPPAALQEPAPAPVESGSDTWIAQQQAAIARNPNNTYAYAQLGLALLDKVRLTSDPLLYSQAETAFSEALTRDPQQLDALTGQGLLALARHDFPQALVWADRADAVNPRYAPTLGIRVDALVELGRYEEAVAAAQAMMDLKPGLPTYSRASYLRELHGDVPGAIQAMQQAADAGAPTSEGVLWSQVQLGHLHFNAGDLAQAETTYQTALRASPDYLHAQAGLARVQAAQGDVEGAIVAYRSIVARLPLPEYVVALGDLLAAAGRPAEAEQQYDLVRAMQQLNTDAGMDVDLEMALFEIEHGSDPTLALEQARAAYAKRPGIHGADTLAWALFHAGELDEAHRMSDEALRLGTRDAMLFYHAGRIAHAEGDHDAARRLLSEALTINPHFSTLHAPTAREILAELGG